jgi:hypothetical protein
VCIGVDAHEAAKFQRTLMPVPVKIKPPRIGINLDRDAVLRAGFKNAL